MANGWAHMPYVQDTRRVAALAGKTKECTFCVVVINPFVVIIKVSVVKKKKKKKTGGTHVRPQEKRIK